jgi:hypothetical protein
MDDLFLDDEDTDLQFSLALQKLPMLQRLALQKIYFNDDLIQYLSNRRNVTKLDTLIVLNEDPGVLMNSNDRAFDEKMLVRTVKSRIKHPNHEGRNLLGQPMTTASLKCVKLPFKDTLLEDTISELKSLRSSGLVVKIH